MIIYIIFIIIIFNIYIMYIIYILYITYNSYNLSKYPSFDTEFIYFLILFLKLVIQLSATKDFTSLCVEYISISLSCNHHCIDLL